MKSETLNAGKERVEELQNELNEKLQAERKRLEELQEQLSGRSREIWLAGLGLFASAEKEGSRLFNEFVEKGQDLIKEGEEVEKRGIEYSKEVRDEIADKVDGAFKFMEDRFQSTMGALGFTNKSDIEDLNGKVDDLTAAVNELTKKLNAKNGKAKASSKK